MWIQSTWRVTREEARQQYIRVKQKQSEKIFLAEVIMMSDEELQDSIEEEFYRYKIKD